MTSKLMVWFRHSHVSATLTADMIDATLAPASTIGLRSTAPGQRLCLYPGGDCIERVSDCAEDDDAQHYQIHLKTLPAGDHQATDARAYRHEILRADGERLKGNPKIRLETFSDAYMNNAQILEFNLDHPTLAKTEVRHALAHAIDREFINDVIFYGHACAAASTIPAALAAYNDEAPFNYPFDLPAANRLLDAAGLKRGGDGTRFSLRLAFLPGALFKQTAEYLRGAFAKVGVKIDILDGDLGTYLKRVYNERGFELNLNGISRLFDPTAGVQRLYWSDGIKNPLPYLNAAHYNNPRVDELFRQAAVELDEANRARQFKEIQQITGAELPAIAVVALPTIIVSNTRAQNYVTTVDVASSDFAQAWVAD
jgi:peptide/nickel transport system substrate-binding protein